MVRRQVEDIQHRVLALLKEKGASGAKAADIRALLEAQGIRMYRATASLALYRLLLLKLVRRNGRLWFPVD